MGVAVADYDNDGYEDLFVTAYGGNRLYHNNGNCTFTDVTDKAGVGGSGWSSSAAWVDLDNDGLLDLVVIAMLPGTGRMCGAESIAKVIAAIAIPMSFSPSPCSCITMTATAISPKSRTNLGSISRQKRSELPLRTTIATDEWISLLRTIPCRSFSFTRRRTEPSRKSAWNLAQP